MKTRKIDLYVLDWAGVWNYKVSTNWSRTCKEAKKRFLETQEGLSPDKVKACRSLIERGQA